MAKATLLYLLIDRSYIVVFAHIVVMVIDFFLFSTGALFESMLTDSRPPGHYQKHKISFHASMHAL